MKDIGPMWSLIREAGVLRGSSSLVQTARQVIIEGRLAEIVVNLGRELVSSHLHPVIEPRQPIYRWDADHLVADRESPLRLDALKLQLDGVCHASTDGVRTWAWIGQSLFMMDSDTNAIEEVHRFPSTIKTMHATSSGHLVVALWGSVHLSSDGGGGFDEVLRLSHDWSRLRSSTLAEDNRGRLLVGEYGNGRDSKGRWQSTAWVHRSDDHGYTWTSSDFIIQAGVNKHIHVVAACPWTGMLYVTSGDNRKWLWTSDSDLSRWKLSSRAPWSLGGYTAVAFTPSATYWGTDYWMGTNFVIANHRSHEPVTWMLGSSLRRNPIPSMAVVQGLAGNHVLVTSANKHRSGGVSALLAFDEAKDHWSTLFLDGKGEAGGVAIAQCSADHESSWAHVHLRGRSFKVEHDGAGRPSLGI